MTRGKYRRAAEAAEKRRKTQREIDAATEKLAQSIRTPLAPGDPRVHHFVPQFLLRGFANERNRIATVRITTPTKSIVSNVANTAAIKDFHTTIDKEVGETVAVEKWISQVEGIADSVIDQLLTAGEFPLSPEDRQGLAGFVALQFVRVPRHRRLQEAMADMAIKVEATLRENQRQTVDKGPTDASADLSEVEFSPHQNQHITLMLRSAQELAPHIASRYLLVAEFQPGGLVITDNPVVLYTRPENRHPFLGVGVATADEILLPVNRRTALIFHSDDLVGDRKINVDNPMATSDFNHLMINGAFEEIYAHPEDVDSLRSLSWPDPNRAVMTVNGGGWVRAQTDGVNAPPVRKKPRRYRGI